MKGEIELGDTVRDRITGYQGVAIARTEWLHGCRRITVQAPELKDGKPVDSATFDEPQLVLVQSAEEAREQVRTGGPQPEPERHSEVAAR